MFKLYETIYDKLGDWIQEWPIVEAADWRSLIESKITDAGYDIAKKLICVYSWQTDGFRQKYLDEIHDIFWRINFYKIKNQTPSADNYYKLLMGMFDDVSDVTKHNEHIDGMFNIKRTPLFVESNNIQIKMISDIKRTNLSDEYVFDIIIDIFKRISIDMANWEYTDINDYIDKDYQN
jgi:hypothetical protein